MQQNLHSLLFQELSLIDPGPYQEPKADGRSHHPKAKEKPYLISVCIVANLKLLIAARTIHRRLVRTFLYIHLPAFLIQLAEITEIS